MSAPGLIAPSAPCAPASAAPCAAAPWDTLKALSYPRIRWLAQSWLALQLTYRLPLLLLSHYLKQRLKLLASRWPSLLFNDPPRQRYIKGQGLPQPFWSSCIIIVLRCHSAAAL